MNRVFKALQDADDVSRPADDGAHPAGAEGPSIPEPALTVQWDTHAQGQPAGNPPVKDSLEWVGDEADSEPHLLLGALSDGNTNSTMPSSPAAPGSVNPAVQYHPPLQPTDPSTERPSTERPWADGMASPVFHDPEAKINTVGQAEERGQTVGDLGKPAEAATVETVESQPHTHGATSSDDKKTGQVQTPNQRFDRGLMTQDSGNVLESLLTPQKQSPHIAAATSPRQLEVECRAQLRHTPDLAQRYEPIAEAVLQRLEAQNHVAVTVVSPVASPEVSALMYHIADALRQRTRHRQLLVDGALKTHLLSTSLQCQESSGVGDFMGLGSYSSDWLVPLSLEATDFLPAGNSIHIHAGAPGSPGELLQQLVAEYPIVLVDAGAETDGTFSQWSYAADLCFLVVRLGETEVDSASLLAESIQRSGGRLSGTIVVE